MFDTVAMSRLTVAAPVGRMADVIRTCTELGCVHIESYTNFEDGVKVGQASASDEANHVSRFSPRSGLPFQRLSPSTQTTPSRYAE